MKVSARPDRLGLIDSLRGLTAVSMIAYHFCWDMVYLAGFGWDWYTSPAAFVWQQSICWSFILISGFCTGFSSRLLRRGTLVFIMGGIITLVTWLLMPSSIVIFGILTFMGSAMIITWAVRKFLPAAARLDPGVVMLLSAVFFLLFRGVNYGYAGILGHPLFVFPKSLYTDLFSTYLGFTAADFFSTDYFSILPWIFLYSTGIGLYGTALNTGFLEKPFLRIKIPLLYHIGRYALPVYMVHQALLYLLVMGISALHG